MNDLIPSVIGPLADRLAGPLHPMLIVQPFAAALLAVMDGVRDAEDGRPPYFWSLVTAAGHRREMLKDGWKGLCKIFVIGAVLDAIYQLIALNVFDVSEAIVVTLALAILPYLLVRGLVTWLLAKRRLSA